MSLLDALWHILNFLAPATFIALFSATAARLVLGREWRAMSWRRSVVWAMLPTLAVAIAGLILTGRDGRMLTYGAMVVAAALGLWIAGLTRRAR